MAGPNVFASAGFHFATPHPGLERPLLERECEEAPKMGAYSRGHTGSSLKNGSPAPFIKV